MNVSESGSHNPDHLSSIRNVPETPYTIHRARTSGPGRSGTTWGTGTIPRCMVTVSLASKSSVLAFLRPLRLPCSLPKLLKRADITNYCGFSLRGSRILAVQMAFGADRIPEVAVDTPAFPPHSRLQMTASVSLFSGAGAPPGVSIYPWRQIHICSRVPAQLFRTRTRYPA